MNKNALMLKFLVTVLLALIIFTPACMFTSKFFSKSEQALNNFYDLAKFVNEVNKKPLGTTENFIFIQDQFTYFYFINDVSRDLFITRDELVNKELSMYLSYSPECKEQNCMCLCRKVVSNDDLTCTSVFCEPTPDVTFSPRSGKFLFRGDDSVTYRGVEVQVPRRQVVKVIKCKAGTAYCKKSKDGDISVIFGFIDSIGGYSEIGGVDALPEPEEPTTGPYGYGDIPTPP